MLEPTKITTHVGVVHSSTLLKRIEIVLELLSKLVLRKDLVDPRVSTIFLVEGPSPLEGHSIFGLENIEVGLNEVVEHIRLEHHLGWAVVAVVVLAHCQISLQAMFSDRTQLEAYLIHQNMVRVVLNGLLRWNNVNQSANDTRLRVRDLDRNVCA